MTAPLREKTAFAVDASPVDPITWVAVRRSLVISGLIGAFLAYVGAFGSNAIPLVPRIGFVVLISWIGAGMGIVLFRLAVRMPWTRHNRLLQGAVAGLLMTPPMSLVVWGASHLVSRGAVTTHELPGYIASTFVVCQAMTLLVVFMNMRTSQLVAARAALASEPMPPKFLERLPLKLRGADVWAVEAEDHYLRLHTSKGQDLILLRLADAVAELEGIEGAQVHRSWWVAREAIADARRGDGRAVLTLKDGSEVPVSRTYAKELRDRGWI